MLTMTWPWSGGRRARRAWLTFALALGSAAAFWVCEALIWTGQPGSGADGSTVVAYYGGQAARVIAGDIVWITACVALVLAAVDSNLFIARPARLTVAAAFVGVAGLAAASAVVAAVLALRAANGGLAPADALGLWSAEGAAFGVAVKLLALALAIAGASLALEPARGQRRVRIGLAVSAAMLAVALWAELLGGIGFAIAPVWLGCLAILFAPGGLTGNDEAVAAGREGLSS